MSNRLTRIQMAVFLQTVDLFTHCSAEQTVRLAAIAEERCFAAGEQVYGADEVAEAMYCVVEGRVVVRRGAQGECLSEAGETFGVEEILSGRLRAAEAVCETAVVALRLDAEDFFDLLSNNIEIVKALFRSLLQPATLEEPQLLRSLSA